MTKKCSKCGGSGWWGSRFDLGPNSKGGYCRRCGGSGDEPGWSTTYCQHCRTTIDYNTKWDRIPEYCENCRRPVYKSCEGCGTSIQYKVYWDNPPKYCQNCKVWHEKSCASCGDTIRYKAFWDNVSNNCKRCKDAYEEAKRLFRTVASRDEVGNDYPLPGSNRTAADMGYDSATIVTYGDSHKHVTVWSRSGSKSRYSWDVDENGSYADLSSHYTDKASDLLRGKYYGGRWRPG